MRYEIIYLYGMKRLYFLIFDMQEETLLMNDFGSLMQFSDKNIAELVCEQMNKGEEEV